MKKSYILIEGEALKNEKGEDTIRYTIKAKISKLEAEKIVYQEEDTVGNYCDTTKNSLFRSFMDWVMNDLYLRDIDEQVKAEIASGKFDDVIRKLNPMFDFADLHKP